MVITIDGPVATGKSTLAQLLAQKLGFYYFNTGMLYRAAAYVFIEQGLGQEKFHALTDNQLRLLAAIEYAYQDSKPVIRLAGVDITSNLYAPEIDQAASGIATLAHVRSKLLQVQQAAGKKYNLIADGRDCGSIVFPTADVKFFLTARPEVRAQRLKNDGQRGYAAQSISDIIQKIHLRDHQDTHRQVAPLMQPTDAILIDSSDLSIDQILDQMIQVVRAAAHKNQHSAA